MESVLITLVIIGILLWIVNTYLPMEATIKKILNVVVIVATILWLLKVFDIVNVLNIGK